MVYHNALLTLVQENKNGHNNKYYKVFETGGHMFIRDAIRKTFNKQFINYVADICSNTTAFERAKSR